MGWRNLIGKNEIIKKVFEALDPTTEEYKKVAWRNNGAVHPFDVIKELDEAHLGIYISILQRKWEEETVERYGKSFFEEIKCVQCNRGFSWEDIPQGFFKFHGVPLHLRCLEDYVKEHGKSFQEKDIRYLARVWGNIWSRDTRGIYNSAEMDILRYFNLQPI